MQFADKGGRGLLERDVNHSVNFMSLAENWLARAAGSRETEAGRHVAAGFLAELADMQRVLVSEGERDNEKWTYYVDHIWLAVNSAAYCCATLACSAKYEGDVAFESGKRVC